MKYSYQSPILTDLNGDQKLEIIGAGHGDLPEYFVRDFEGNYLENWPKSIDNWTFSTPSLLIDNNEKQILMSRPIGGDENVDMLYAWNENGILNSNFPIKKTGGLEGLIAIADVDNDSEAELVFGSNLYNSETGTSFLHAYNIDGSGEVAGFPIELEGWTYMNGANIGDVNGDGLMDAVLLTYTQNFGTAPDSAFIHAYNLGVPYSEDRVWWTTYKGSNSRDGNFANVLSNVIDAKEDFEIPLFPNPTYDKVFLDYNVLANKIERIELFNGLGKLIKTFDAEQRFISLNSLEKGFYFIDIQLVGKKRITQKIIYLGN